MTSVKGMCSAHRHRGVVVQAFSPGLNPLHRSKVGACPVKPFVVAVAPLAVMDQNLFSFVVDFLDVGSIPTRLKSAMGDSGEGGAGAGTFHTTHFLSEQRQFDFRQGVVPGLSYCCIHSSGQWLEMSGCTWIRTLEARYQRHAPAFLVRWNISEHFLSPQMIYCLKNKNDVMKRLTVSSSN